jgi:hypothetical protein
MSSSAQSSEARQVLADPEISGAVLRWADEDICRYVVCGSSHSAQDDEAYFSRIPTIDADIRFAMVPAIMARKPSLASSPRLLGASALMPPI